jgi:class 3 adenylate cyclase
VNIIAIIYNFVPPPSRAPGFPWILVALTVIDLCVLAIILKSARSFRRYAKLPSWVATFLVFYVETLGRLFAPLWIELNFWGIAMLIWSPDGLDSSLSIALIVVSSTLFGVYIWLVIAVGGSGLSWRPESLQTICPMPHRIISLTCLLEPAVLGFAAPCPYLGVQIACLVIAIGGYVLTIVACFTSGGFVRRYITNAVLATSVLGIVSCIVVMTCRIFGEAGGLYHIFGLFFLFFIALVGAEQITRKRFVRSIEFLQAVANDPDLWQNMDRPGHLAVLAVHGFQSAEEVAINGTLFQRAQELWPDDIVVAFVSAKFLAVYPENIQPLEALIRRIERHRLSGGLIRTIERESMVVIRQRTGTLTCEIRQRLRAIERQMIPLRHKLRHVWDSAIQGNVGEIERSVRRAIKCCQAQDAEFQHIVQQYPNNTHITARYSRFLNDVLTEYEQAREMHERTATLLRSVIIHSDQARDYALEVFPNLPKHLARMNPRRGGHMESQMDVDPPEDTAIDLESVATLRERIHNLQVPSIVALRIFSIIYFLVFGFGVPLGIIMYARVFRDDLGSDLTVIHDVANLRVVAIQVPAWALRYLGERLDVFETSDSPREPPVTLGNSWDTGLQLKAVVEATTAAVQQASSLRTFGTSSARVRAAQDYLFGRNVPYKDYVSKNSYESKVVSIQGALMEFVIQINELFVRSNVTVDVMSSSVLLNPLANFQVLVDRIDLATGLTVEGLIEKTKDMRSVAQILYSTLIGFGCVILVTAIVFESFWIKRSKQEVYRCLLVVPKTILSQFSNDFRVAGRKDIRDQLDEPLEGDMNKQEETILNILHNRTSRTSDLKDISLCIAGSLGIALLELVGVACAVWFASSATDAIRLFTPYLQYLMAAYGHGLSAIIGFHLLSLAGTPYQVPTRSYDKLVNLTVRHLQNATQLYLGAKFGDSEAGITPMDFMDKSYAIVQSGQHCYEDVSPFANHSHRFSQATYCYRADMQYVLIEPLLMEQIVTTELSGTDAYRWRDWIWSLWADPIYHPYFVSVFTGLIPTIWAELDSYWTIFFAPMICVMLLSALLELKVLFQSRAPSAHVRAVLKLMLRVPTADLMQVPKFMKVLGGDFSVQVSDAAAHSPKFYQTIFDRFPGIALWADSYWKIEAMSETCRRTFGSSILGTDIRTFFESPAFDVRPDHLWDQDGPQTQLLRYSLDTGGHLCLQTSVRFVMGKVIVICQDITPVVQSEEAIRIERKRIHDLLSELLPPLLVSRVHQCEETLVIQQHAASVIFLNIVGFSVWCRGQPAARVQVVLNRIFGRFEGLLQHRPTLTKIKTISDCFIVAGGLFPKDDQTLPQPSEHAKELVSFGLDSIRALQDTNVELNERFDIRVGAAIGPVVAGVVGSPKSERELGRSRPTFEIIGTAIREATQMERMGTPMIIHITRRVYEVIYGDCFQLRPNPQRFGPSESYIVTGRMGRGAA